MMYPLINILGKEIGTYALFSITGILLCGFLAAKLGKSRYIYYDKIIFLILSIIGGIVAGGHLLYGITNLPMMCSKLLNSPRPLISQFLDIISSGFGGMVFYGGFLGACISIFVFSRFNKALKISDIFDVFAVCIPLFHCFGRIGCFFGGCCYGVESDFGILIYDNPFIPYLNGVRRFPIQLVEALCNLSIFLILLALFKKNKCQNKLIYVYMLIYPIVRFITEMLRGDEIRGIWYGLSTSQWISIILFIFSLFRLFQIKLYRAK